jgi:hypothetical protein
MDSLYQLISQHPPPAKKLSYGTAGFRDRHDLPLDPIFYRVGVLVRTKTLDHYLCTCNLVTCSSRPT